VVDLDQCAVGAVFRLIATFNRKKRISASRNDYAPLPQDRLRGNLCVNAPVACSQRPSDFIAIDPAKQSDTWAIDIFDPFLHAERNQPPPS
jgi:hypothetical protein